jgi:basic membrane protein A
MSIRKPVAATLAALALGATSVAADPAIIFDLGGKFDKSFNEAAYQRRGALGRGNRRQLPRDRDAVRSPARAGAAPLCRRRVNPVVMTGFAFGNVLAEVAPTTPTPPSSSSTWWSMRPTCARSSSTSMRAPTSSACWPRWPPRSGTVGFVGGMDIPLIRNFACGYVQGAKAVNPDIEVIQNMTGTTPAAWNDPVKGAELTRRRSPGRRRGLCRGGRHRPRRAAGRRRRRHPVHRRRQQPELPAPRLRS